MKQDESICQLFDRSEDSLIVLQGKTVIQTNKAAVNLLNGISTVKGNIFSLAGFSPGIQPGGESSEDYEQRIFRDVSRTGYTRTGWVLKDRNEEEFYVELTLICNNNKDNPVHYLFLRDVNEEVGMRKGFISIQKDMDLKSREIDLQKEEIETHREAIETQRDIALKQRDEITIQKKDITDSITYASRIQSALLPKKEIIDRIFQEYFILYKPRDIIGGDFYWVSQKGSRVIMAAADCTGHGVPGALMSIMGMAFLDEIVNNHGIVRPDLILNDLRERVIKALGQRGISGETSDGMDIALLCIDYDKYTLQFSGAFNPLIIIRDNNMIELKADHMTLSYHRGNDPSFINQEIEIATGDSLYIFSDGYIDQFGWRDDKKYKLRCFKDLLLSLQDIPMEGQKVLLENDLNHWKGDVPQLDDILVVGIKI